jgi:glycosyltransferase involved in cell wall biosynthesis
MRILQLTKKFPHPVADGECLAINHLARAFHELGHEVTLLAMNTARHPGDIAASAPALGHYHQVHSAPVDNRIKPLNALINLLFSRDSYHIERFVGRGYADTLAGILQKNTYDVVQLETLYLAPYIPVIRRYSEALVVMRAHNVEHEIWERIALGSSAPKRWYLQELTARLQRYETETVNATDLMVAISERDLGRFRSMGMHIPGVVTPIGIDSRRYTPDDDSFRRRPLSLSFIGSLDWLPNQEGLRWFLHEVWIPEIRPRFPEMTFHIAGRNAPDWLRRLEAPGVVVHGEVHSAADFIRAHSVMVVPLLSGGGMRAKALEGMALGKVVLSTPIGMEGIDAVHGDNCLLADTPQAMVEAIAWGLAHPDDLLRIGNQARQTCLQRYDSLQTARALLEVYAAR